MTEEQKGETKERGQMGASFARDKEKRKSG